MILLKPFLILAGSVAGTVGLTSLSSLKDWDPSNVWRVSAKYKFYLFTCKQSDQERNKQHWKESEMQVYLKFKDGNRTLQDDKELKLEGIGYSLSKGIKNKTEDLHASGAGSQNESIFALKLFNSGNAGLGELGSDQSYNYGDNLHCGKSWINIENKTPTRQEDIGLKDVSFKLKDCQPKKDNKRQECSIDIIYKTGTQNKKLEWVDNFKPIVIN